MGEHPLFPPVEVDLDPVAVKLDFMEPPVAGGRPGFQRRELRLNVGAEAESATRFFARLAITLLKTSAYRATLKETRDSSWNRSFGNGCDIRRQRRHIKQQKRDQRGEAEAAVTATIALPGGSISSPIASGASAWAIRDGAPISPKRYA